LSEKDSVDRQGCLSYQAESLQMKKRKKSPVAKDFREDDMRLQRIISRAGVASRREAEKMITEGRISLNGEVVVDFGIKANPAQDEISVDGEPIHFPKYKYYLFNKPEGLKTTKPINPDDAKSTIWTLLPVDKSLNSVGRLDRKSEGALVITNDGELINMMTHPSFLLEKTYQIHVRGNFEKESVIQLEKGVWLSDGKMHINRVKVKKRKKEFTLIEVVIDNKPTEHLREVFKKLGHPVSRITRTKVGPLSIEDIERGEYKRLKNFEIVLLKEYLSKSTTKSRKRKERPTKPRINDPKQKKNKKTPDSKQKPTENDVEFIG